MQKDVLVVDENNVIYGGTYPKRAKGLVKKGRARFIDEHTICMTRPPEQTEDQMMSDLSHTTTNTALTIAYLLEQIEAIAKGTSHLDPAVSELMEMTTGVMSDDCVPDIAGQAKANALATVIQCRETTNQRLLALYEKMYDDLKSGVCFVPDAAVLSAKETVPLPALETAALPADHIVSQKQNESTTVQKKQKQS